MSEYLSVVMVPLDGLTRVEKDGVTYVLIDADEFNKAIIYGTQKAKGRANVKEAELVLAIIKNNPGISRNGIEQALLYQDVRFTVPFLTNVITGLRRRNEIENRGTRKEPLWFPTD